MSDKMDTIWSKLDRKSTAIAEFTMRQYRTRISTWVVMVMCHSSGANANLVGCMGRPHVCDVVCMGVCVYVSVRVCV